jgi:DHA2 family multidrug resistance protein-like MFS transporter
MAGAVLGPVVGGLLLERFWWGSVFLLNVPIMVLLLASARALLPEYRAAHAGRIDLISVVLSLATIMSIIYVLKEFAAKGTETSAWTLLPLAVGLTAGPIFVRRQLRLSQPLLDLRLFQDRSFGTVAALMLLCAAMLGGLSFLASQYLQIVAGQSPSRTGLWLAPAAVGMAVGSLLAPAIARRIRPSTTIAVGQALAVIGMVALTRVGSDGGTLLLICGVTVVHLGMAPLFALGTDLIVGSAPPAKAGSAASISETSSELGVSLGLATLGSVAAATYHHHLGPAPGPAADSLAGASTVAAHLPAGDAAALLHAAFAAFTAGLNVAAIVGVVLLAILAVLAATLPRRVPTGADPVPAAEADHDPPPPAAGTEALSTHR